MGNCADTNSIVSYSRANRDTCLLRFDLVNLHLLVFFARVAITSHLWTCDKIGAKTASKTSEKCIQIDGDGGKHCLVNIFRTAGLPNARLRFP